MFIPNCNWLPYYLKEQYECDNYESKSSVDKLSDELDELHETNMEYLKDVNKSYDKINKSLESINKNYDSCLDSLSDIKEGMKDIISELKEESKRLEIERYGHEL